MNILLFGPNGQVGFELSRSLSTLGNVIHCPRSVIDLNNLSSLAEFIRKAEPDVLVNAAAYTHVDMAESNSATAQSINRDAPHIMAKTAAEMGSLFIHYSTDYVFNGAQDAPYVETDPFSPINIYGKTKAEGELAIRETGCRHLILRTSWIYSTRGKNFLNSILKLAREQTQMRIVNDQIGAPTSAEMIADVTALLLYKLTTNPTMRDFSGDTYHLAASGETSWHGFASHIVEKALQKGAVFTTTLDNIIPISTAQFPTPAKRPASSRLSTQKLTSEFNLLLPDWKLHVERILSELANIGAL
jgi:dTDP-4-dehydrorhamnose reductase